MFKATTVNYLFDLHFVSSDDATSLLDQLLSHALSLERDETEVLGLVVLAFVDRSDDLGDGSVLAEVFLDVLFSQSRVGQLANIHLAGFDVCLLHSDTFTLIKFGD